MSLYLRDYRLIFEATREGVLAIGQRGIRDANPALCSLLGYTHSQLLRVSVLDLLTAGSKVVLERQLSAQASSPSPHFAFPLLLVDRRSGAVPVTARLLRCDGGWLIFIEEAPGEDDVTEVGRTPVARPEARDRYRQLVEHLADGLITLNDVGDLLFVNRAFAQMLGIPARSRLVSRPLLDLVVPEDRERVARGVRRWEEGEPTRFEASLRHADGSEVPVLLSGRSVPPSMEGLPPGLLVLVTDFAERRALVEKLALTRQMEALSSLAGGIAHDFNNLLTGILGNASAIRSLTAPTDRVSDLALGVEESAELAARLTQRLLAVVRGQAPNRELLDVGVLVKETLHLLERVIPESIVIETHFADNVPPVLADQSQLQQAILNLCINARDAMMSHSGGGALRLSVGADLLSKPLDDGDVAQEPAVALRVADTGPGVPEQLRRRIFDPFFTTKGLGRGMGLGLSSVFNLAEAHGGAVDVDRAPRGGAQFTLRLPALPGRHAEPDSRPASRPPLPLLRGSGTVLLAEDETGIRKMVASTLTNQGYTVLAAADGREALELYEEHGPAIDLLVLDVRMPHVDGTEVLRQIRAQDPLVPAVLSSGFIPEEKEAQALPERISYLPKPYRMPDLLFVVGRAMAGPPSGEYTQVTPTGDVRVIGVTDEHGTVAPAGKGFDPGRTLTEGEMPAILTDFAHLLGD
ncbi:MAG: PAS domain S-box protein [Deltaproteobacteria bacterium]|nr:PAS domain S-box protein [Deltaproteobacteria bacterium]